jgi:hypothetical protein
VNDWIHSAIQQPAIAFLGVAEKQDELKQSFKDPAPFSSQIQQCPFLS